MSDQPQPPASPNPEPSTFLRVLPVIPIGIALLVALIFHFQRPAPPAEIDPIGSKAPDFTLRDAHKEESDPAVTLSLLVEKGPVLIIFYRGYSCPRCIGHLSQIAGQIDDYTKAGIQVLAISPDTPANTRDSIQTYGDFPFPLLSDRDDKVARAFGLQEPDGTYLHGAFIIDKDRRFQFVARTDHPYGDAASLLEEAKKLLPR